MKERTKAEGKMRLLSSVKLLPQVRWCFLSRLYSQQHSDELIRNFGILAHIDAGTFIFFLFYVYVPFLLCIVHESDDGNIYYFREDNNHRADAFLLGHNLSHG